MGGRTAERALGPGPGPFAKLLNEFVSQRSFFLLASLNYLMNLFPRRSYFLLAISMGPTSLYPDKPSPKNDPFFWYIEKEPQRPYDQNGGSIAPRSLIFDPFAKETVSQKTRILGAAVTAATAAEEFPVPARPHPTTQGYHIPFGSSALNSLR